MRADPNSDEQRLSDSTFDVEQAIRNWRTELARQGSLRITDLEELESHLRDELEALTDNGIGVAEAFAHATSRLGTTQAIGDEFARGNPLFAWRLPGLFFCAGALFYFLGDPVRALAETLVLLACRTFNLGVVAGSIAHVLVFVVPPIAGIALIATFGRAIEPGSGLRLPHRLRAVAESLLRRRRLVSLARIGFVVGLGLFVFLVESTPLIPSIESAIRPLGPERIRLLNSWSATAASTYRLVWHVRPAVLALAMVIVRHRLARGRVEERATFWMLAGLLVHDLWSNLSSIVLNATLLGSHLSGASPMLAGQTLYATSIGLQIVLLGIMLVSWRRLPPPNIVLESPRTDVVALLLGGVCLVLTYRFDLFPTVRAMDRSMRDAVLHAWSMMGAVVDLVAPALLGAFLLHLRARLTADGNTALAESPRRGL